MGTTTEAFLAKRPEVLDEDRTVPEVGQWVARLTAPLAWYFRYQVHHWEQVPAGPMLLVSNHNAGAVHEILLLHRAWKQRFADRPARGLLHRVAWHWPLRALPLLQWLGGVFAHPEAARRALARGCALLIYPGGDEEALREFSQRYQVDFAGRHGFARLAREAQVPVVPLVTCGAHATYVMLPGGHPLSKLTGVRRLLGVKRFPVTGGAVLAALALGATLMRRKLWPLVAAALAQAFIPLPSKIEAEFLPPMRPGVEESDEGFAARVQAAMQAGMDRLAARRKTALG